MENEFVSYLNTLHNYNAQNANVFAEKNIKSYFYKKIMVDIPICDFIVEHLKNDIPHVVVLTGHAGDGKTSLMYQVLNCLGASFNSNEKKLCIDISNDKKCIFVKDFSELSDEDKISTLKEIIKKQSMGYYAFLVANTGPLISNFSRAFDTGDKEKIQTDLIKLLAENTGEIEEINGLKISVINVVAVNNAFFSNEFIDKIIVDELWEDCQNCSKKNYCPIIRNINLIKTNKTKVKDFIYNHYIWLSEYGERLTIRSMTQQLSFMITGGLNCRNVKEYDAILFLSSNLFFGYIGPKIDKKALEINSIYQTNICNYDKKRLRSDEQIFINKDYENIFCKDLKKIINDSENAYGSVNGWHLMIKRMYLFYNTQTKNVQNDLEDVFSKEFSTYIDIKFKDSAILPKDNSLIKDALSMLNIGIIESQKNDIPITLNRESGYVQNVQYVVGMIKRKKIRLEKQLSNHSKYLGDKRYNDIYISIAGYRLKKDIDLPLLDYFSDLRSGIINTNIDAQLSKGLETIKSEILSIAKDDEDDDILNLIVSNTEGYYEISLEINNGYLTGTN